MPLKSYSLAQTFSPSPARAQPWRARLTALPAGPAPSPKASAAPRSSLSSRHRTRHQPYLNLGREKVDGKRSWRAETPSPTASPLPAQSRLTPSPHGRSRCPRSQPGRAAAPSDPRATEPPAPSPHSARRARNPRPAEPSPPTPSWLLTGALFTLHSSSQWPTLTPGAAPSRLTRV